MCRKEETILETEKMQPGATTPARWWTTFCRQIISTAFPICWFLLKRTLVELFGVKEKTEYMKEELVLNENDHTDQDQKKRYVIHQNRKSWGGRRDGDVIHTRTNENWLQWWSSPPRSHDWLPSQVVDSQGWGSAPGRHQNASLTEDLAITSADGSCSDGTKPKKQS